MVPSSGTECTGVHPVPMEPRKMTDEVLTIKEIAEFLKLAEKTVYSMAQRGELPAFKVRGQWRIRRADLERWIEQQQKGPTQGRGVPARE